MKRLFITIALVALGGSHLSAQPGPVAAPPLPPVAKQGPPPHGADPKVGHRLAAVVRHGEAGGGSGGEMGGGMPLPFGANPFSEPSKRTLVIRASKGEVAQRVRIEEDLNVMSRILDKALERGLASEARERKLGIAVFALPGARGENIYLEDYGAVFVLQTSLPLLPADQAERKDDQKPASDWEEAKRELYAKNSPGAPFQPMRYEASKVEALKKELLEALKNGANIRELKPDQTITVVVIGSPTGPVVHNRRVVSRSVNGVESREESVEAQSPTPGHSRQSTLTIRAKKSDIDAFAKDKLDADAFAKKADVAIY